MLTLQNKYFFVQVLRTCVRTRQVLQQVLHKFYKFYEKCITSAKRTFPCYPEGRKSLNRRTHNAFTSLLQFTHVLPAHPSRGRQLLFCERLCSNGSSARRRQKLRRMTLHTSPPQTQLAWSWLALTILSHSTYFAGCFLILSLRTLLAPITLA